MEEAFPSILTSPLISQKSDFFPEKLHIGTSDGSNFFGSVTSPEELRELLITSFPVLMTATVLKLMPLDNCKFATSREKMKENIKKKRRQFVRDDA